MNVHMTDTLTASFEVDAMGKPCPMPLLMLKKQLKKMSSGQTVLVKSSDPHSEIDISRYCQLHTLSCQVKQISNYEFHYLIES